MVHHIHNAAGRTVEQLPLVAVVLALTALRSTRWLGGLLVLMGLIQAADAGLGLLQHDLGKTLGPAIFATSQFWAAGWLLRQSRS